MRHPKFTRNIPEKALYVEAELIPADKRSNRYANIKITASIIEMPGGPDKAVLMQRAVNLVSAMRETLSRGYLVGVMPFEEVKLDQTHDAAEANAVLMKKMGIPPMQPIDFMEKLNNAIPDIVKKLPADKKQRTFQNATVAKPTKKIVLKDFVEAAEEKIMAAQLKKNMNKEWQKHCGTLGVAPAASADEIHATLRKSAHEMHPDRRKEDANAGAKYQKIIAARKYLKPILDEDIAELERTRTEARARFRELIQGQHRKKGDHPEDPPKGRGRTGRE